MVQYAFFTSLLSSLLVLGLAAGAWGCNSSKHQNIVTTTQEVQENTSTNVVRNTTAESDLGISNSSHQGLPLVGGNREIEPVEIKAFKLKRQSADGRCVIDIEYPQIEGLTDPSVQQRVNSKLRNQFLQAPGRTLNVRKCTSDDAYLRSKEDIFGWKSGYEIGLNQRGVLSINGYASLTPGAYPLNLAKTITFNLKDGSVYSYSSLFKLNSGYVNLVNQLIREEIREYLESNASLNQLDSGEIQNVLSQFQPKKQYQFYLSNQGLVLVDIFDVHALQAIKAEIEHSKIRKIIDPNGPLRATQEN